MVNPRGEIAGVNYEVAFASALEAFWCLHLMGKCIHTLTIFRSLSSDTFGRLDHWPHTHCQCNPSPGLLNTKDRNDFCLLPSRLVPSLSLHGLAKTLLSPFCNNHTKATRSTTNSVFCNQSFFIITKLSITMEPALYVKATES